MKSLIFISLFISCVITSYSQVDTIRTYFPNGKIESETVYQNGMRQGEAKYYWENGNIKENLFFYNDKIEGLIRNYYENGNIKEMYTIEDGKRIGPTSLFDSTGAPQKDIFFENGIRSGQEYVLIGKYRQEDYEKLLAEWKERQANLKKSDAETILPPKIEPEETDDDPAYYINVEVLPEPIGGMNTIYKKLSYPQQAVQNKIEGTVEILAFIEKNGEVSKAEVVKGIGYGCDENARLAVYFTRFKPGLQKGKRVKVQRVIPVEFKLDRKTN